MTSSLRHSIILGFEIRVIFETNQLAKFQISLLSGSNFTEARIKQQKHHFNIIMTSFHNIALSKLHILLKIIDAISLLSFIVLGYLDQILQRQVDNTPSPTDLTRSKKAQSFKG